MSYIVSLYKTSKTSKNDPVCLMISRHLRVFLKKYKPYILAVVTARESLLS